MATELDELHLADLHDRAAAAGISGYRLMRREELVAALGDADGAPAAPDPPVEAEEKPDAEPKTRRRRSRRRRRAEPEPKQEPEADTDEMAVVEATVLDDTADKPVELEPSGAPDDQLPTQEV